jgi:HlyD family secretion protein
LIDLSVVFCRGRQVTRRELVIFVTSAAAFWPVAARAQHSALPGIRFLSGASLEAMRDYLRASTPRALVAQAADNQSRLQSFWALQLVYCSAVTNDSRLISTAHARSDRAGAGSSSTLFKLYRKQEKAMRPVRLSATALMAIAALAFSIFTIPALNGSVHTSTAQAQSKIDELNSQAKSKVEELNKQAKELIERLRHGDLPEGIAKTNGRIEATEVDVSSKYAGRLESVMVDEGDEVKVGQVIARIDSPEYEAQLRTAQANVLVAQDTLASGEAKVAQAQADLVYATGDLERGKELVEKGWMTKQVYDQRVDRFSTDKAAVDASEKQRDAAKSVVEAAQAEVERINSILKDLTILSPGDGRVQYRLHRSGEVVNAGQRIVQILDLKDVYMTIYLPAAQAGRLAIGDEARVIVDPYPDSVIPANVSFVATEAEFTPKTVETADEREKLIFRAKLQIDPKVLTKYYSEVKTGIRGMGFVRTDRAVSWPQNLAVKLSHGE